MSVQESLKSTVQLVNGFVAFGGGTTAGESVDVSVVNQLFSPQPDVLFPTLLPTRERRAEPLQSGVHPGGTHAAAPRPETSQGFWLLFRLCPPLICLNPLLNKAL